MIGASAEMGASAQGGNKDPPRDRRKRRNGRNRPGGELKTPLKGAQRPIQLSRVRQLGRARLFGSRYLAALVSESLEGSE